MVPPPAASRPPTGDDRLASVGIIPAAGRSRRMGRSKLLMPWHHTTVLGAVVAAWQTSSVERLVVVVRPDDQPLARHVVELGAELVVPHDPPPDMKASIQAALQYVAANYRPDAESCWLVAPGDQPGLSAQLIDQVLGWWRRSVEPIAVPMCQGRGGHPCAFAWPLAAAAARLAPDHGLNQLLLDYPVRRWETTDRNCLQDLDTPDDYRRARE